MKNILGIHRSPHAHWVGDGFPVRSLFTYDNLASRISRSCCWTTLAPMTSPRPRRGAALASTRTAASRQ